MECKFSRVAAHYIKSQDKPTRERLKAAIMGLMEIPPNGDIKLMQGYKDHVYRLRVGGYRVIYEFCEIDGQQCLYIRDIGSRGDIYK